jgi:hypothetical protein
MSRFIELIDSRQNRQRHAYRDIPRSDNEKIDVRHSLRIAYAIYLSSADAVGGFFV